MQSELKQKQASFSFLRGGGYMGELTRNFDWSKTALGTPDQWPQSLRTSVSIILNSQFPMFVWWGQDLITFYNDAYINVAGDKHPALLGKSGREAWSEIWNDLSPLVEDVFNGNSTWSEDLVLNMNRHGYIEETYFTFSYSPVLNESGAVGGLFCACIETTEKVIGKKKLEESERNLRNTILQSPVASCILKQPNHIIEVANQRIIEMWGATGRDILGKPIFEAIPEVKGQGFETLLAHVYNTGETYKAYGVPLNLLQNGSVQTYYIDFVYQAYRESDGTISGIIAVAIDVTEQVMARQNIERAEERVRMAVASADLGTYEINLVTKEMLTSDRFNQIWGVDHSLTREEFAAALHPDDLQRRSEANEQVAQKGGLIYEARVIRKDDTMRWVRITGKNMFDDKGQPSMLIGVVQDITEQKLFAEELRKQVQERTAELEGKNKELQRSNQNLEEFAHAASHDLKEPIRKIHFFTDRLKHQLEERITAEEKLTFNRIENASQRMSSLIDDLLLYSHVSQRPHEKEEVDLTEKVKKVLEDLELDIQQKGALITYDKLPIVKGYRRQLQQLFQNLIGNALKYSKPGIVPEISMTSKLVNNPNTGSNAEETAITKFHLIEVKDNGIGFEQENAERIFQMFQRLHGNSEYRGTGVGLSIAKKVVENHNGKIVAESEPGKGATFKVYLPAT